MKIIVIGCGRVGASVAQSLSLNGHEVVVVDRDPAAFDRLPAAFRGEKIVGVGFDREVLRLGGIERADALGAVTGSDEANIVVARIAREVFAVPRVVARLYDPRKADIYQRLGLQTISPTAWGSARIIELLTHSRLNTILTLGGGTVDIVEEELPPLLVGRAVQDVTIPGEVQVVAISRGGQSFLPAPQTIFQQGDLLHVALLTSSAARLEDLLGYRA
jgi:trk system potassium uptake protein